MSLLPSRGFVAPFVRNPRNTTGLGFRGGARRRGPRGLALDSCRMPNGYRRDDETVVTCRTKPIGGRGTSFSARNEGGLRPRRRVSEPAEGDNTGGRCFDVVARSDIYLSVGIAHLERFFYRTFGKRFNLSHDRRTTVA